MKQKLNKKLVKRLPDVIVINDGTEDQLRTLIKSVTNLVPSTFKNKFYEIAKHCVTSYNSVNCGFSKKGAQVISVKDFFKPAKVKLKDVDKPIWFPDSNIATKYTDLLWKKGNKVVFGVEYDGEYISYKDIKWPKTKSSLEDRVTALEHYRKETNTILSNIVYKISSPEEQNKIDCLNGIIDEAEDIVKEFKELKQKEEVIDWSKPQYFQSKTGVIVLCDGTEIGNKFGGTVVKGYMVIKLGQYRNTWRKNDFKPFKGTITV